MLYFIVGFSIAYAIALLIIVCSSYPKPPKGTPIRLGPMRYMIICLGLVFSGILFICIMNFIYAPDVTSFTETYELTEVNSAHDYYTVSDDGQILVLIRGEGENAHTFASYDSELVSVQKGSAPETRVEKERVEIPLKDKISLLAFLYPANKGFDKSGEKVTAVTIVIPEGVSISGLSVN